nr:hypothetical protein [Tanacetum cinerariifolium]
MSDSNYSSSKIAKLTHAVNQQTSAVTTAMIAILKQFQATPPPAFVKAIWVIHQLKPIKHPLLINHLLLDPRRNERLGGNRGRRQSLQEQVFNLQEAKDAQSKEITALKKKVSKLLKWRKSRSRGLRRLMKIGSGRRVKTPLEKGSLGAQEDASKHRRMIDQDDEITLDVDTQGRKNDDEMFGVDDLSGEEVVTTVADKSVKPTIPAAATKVTTAVPTVRAKGIVFHEQKQSHIPIVSSSKDKGKAKMIEPEVPIKKKDQMRMDEEYARQLNDKEQEAARLSRAQQDEEANIS